MKKHLTLIMLLTVVVAFAATAFAQKRPMKDTQGKCQYDQAESGLSDDAGYQGDIKKGMKCGMGGMGGISLSQLSQLELSDAQKTAVANILAERRDNARALADQLQDAKKAFYSTLDSDPLPDEAALRAAHQGLAGAREAQIMDKLELMSALKTILTEDQFAALKAANGRHPHKNMKGMKHGDKMKMKKATGQHREMMDLWIDKYSDK